jgi:hypothetical protein
MGCGAFCLLLLVSLHVSYVKQVATLDSTSKAFKKNNKNPKKIDGWNPQRGDKKGRPKKGQKTHKPHQPRKKKKVSPSHVRRQFHPQPSNVAWMQIMKSNRNNERSKTSITNQHNFSFYNRG